MIQGVIFSDTAGILDKYPRSRKAFAKILRRAAFLLFEDAVKVGNIIEPAIVGYFSNRLRSVDQHAGGMSQSYFGETVYKRIACTLFEKAAECCVGHIGQPRYLI